MDEENTIDAFKPYRKRYHNLTELIDATVENKVLGGAVEKANSLTILKDVQL